MSAPSFTCVRWCRHEFALPKKREGKVLPVFPAGELSFSLALFGCAKATRHEAKDFPRELDRLVLSRLRLTAGGGSGAERPRGFLEELVRGSSIERATQDLGGGRGKSLGSLSCRAGWGGEGLLERWRDSWRRKVRPPSWAVETSSAGGAGNGGRISSGVLVRVCDQPSWGSFAICSAQTNLPCAVCRELLCVRFIVSNEACPLTSLRPPHAYGGMREEETLA